MSDEESRYAAHWDTWTLIPAGAGWAFAVGIIEQSGRRRVRVAKGKIKIAGPNELPITQQLKFNLKPADWKPLRTAIDQYVAQLASEARDTSREPDVDEDEQAD
jgi:hypothetical protein